MPWTCSVTRRWRPAQAISQQELDDAIQNEKTAAAEVEADKAAVEQAQLNLDFTTIRSPVDGVAGLAKAQVGDLIGPRAGPLTTVAKMDPIRVYFSVSQQLMTQMQERRLAEGKGSVRTRRRPGAPGIDAGFRLGLSA